MDKFEYNPSVIEPKHQKSWEESQKYTAKEELNREPFYCLAMFPYPSGNLHIGHVRNYVLADIIARYQRMQGYNVIHPIGWDAFGLPAENAARKHGTSAAEWTYANIDTMRSELKRLGLSYDWQRELATCNPEYYKWSQWLFLQMYKQGLAYKKKSYVNWDPVDQTVLANEQVINGCGWRSGAKVERKEIEQWFLKITKYAEELSNKLDTLTGWPEQVKLMQKNWIGISQGLEITFKLTQANAIDALKVFTTRPDTLMGATYLAISPDHELAKQVATTNADIADFLTTCKNQQTAEANIETAEKIGIDTGLTVQHPLNNNAKLPVWIANYVLINYGHGAVMAVPAHDQRDFEFANKYSLPIVEVITPSKPPAEPTTQAYTGPGTMINSEKYNNLSNQDAGATIGEDLIKLEMGQFQKNIRLHDWGISRQRYWGTPIPIIYCDKCGIVPVPETDLPVVLPHNIQPTVTGSPLANHKDFYQTPCPTCSQPARREVDTMDTFVDSAWYFIRYCCPEQHDKISDNRSKYWLPVNQYIGGIEHANLHLLYARFIYKVMRDLNKVGSDEPFTNLLTQGMVLKDGSKMSKSKGNIVAPLPLIEKYGADALRIYITFAAPPNLDLEWTDSGIEGCYKFIKKIIRLVSKSLPQLRQPEHQESLDLKNIPDNDLAIYADLNKIIEQINYDMKRSHFNTVVSGSMKITNILVEAEQQQQTNHVFCFGIYTLLKILAPIAPHITTELWETIFNNSDLATMSWPTVDRNALSAKKVTIVIQINGKLKARMDCQVGLDNEIIQQLALEHPTIVKGLADSQYKKIIVVKDKLINIVV